MVLVLEKICRFCQLSFKTKTENPDQENLCNECMNKTIIQPLYNNDNAGSNYTFMMQSQEDDVIFR
jgi:hypothetical protein